MCKSGSKSGKFSCMENTSKFEVSVLIGGPRVRHHNWAKLQHQKPTSMTTKLELAQVWHKYNQHIENFLTSTAAPVQQSWLQSKAVFPENPLMVYWHPEYPTYPEWSAWSRISRARTAWSKNLSAISKLKFQFDSWSFCFLEIWLAPVLTVLL